MVSRMLIVLVLSLALASAGCARLPGPARAAPTPTLPACTDAYEQVPFPTLTPAPVEDLRNVARSIADCWVDTGTTISYPCSRQESIEETRLSETPRALLILRRERYSAGCWTAVTSEQTSLRYVNRPAASTTLVARHIRSDVVASPDGTVYAFGASETTTDLAVALYLVRVADGQVTRLDPQPLPQPAVLGVRFLSWSEDGAWLAVSLWDGSEDGWHAYRLRTDGSGMFEQP